jgi:hypothetical protein
MAGIQPHHDQRTGFADSDQVIVVAVVALLAVLAMSVDSVLDCR